MVSGGDAVSVFAGRGQKPWSPRQTVGDSKVTSGWCCWLNAGFAKTLGSNFCSNFTSIKEYISVCHSRDMKVCLVGPWSARVIRIGTAIPWKVLWSARSIVSTSAFELFMDLSSKPVCESK
jgi:hypothetical protein